MIIALREQSMVHRTITVPCKFILSYSSTVGREVSRYYTGVTLPPLLLTPLILSSIFSISPWTISLIRTKFVYLSSFFFPDKLGIDEYDIVDQHTCSRIVRSFVCSYDIISKSMKLVQDPWHPYILVFMFLKDFTQRFTHVSVINFVQRFDRQS